MRTVVARRPSAEIAAHDRGPSRASVEESWASRVSIVCGVAGPSIDLESRTSQEVAVRAQGPTLTPGLNADRSPCLRSARVGPWSSSRSACSPGGRLGTTRSTRTSLPFRTKATSTVSGSGFGFAAIAEGTAAALGAADGSRSTARRPAAVSTRTTRSGPHPGRTRSPSGGKDLPWMRKVRP